MCKHAYLWEIRVGDWKEKVPSPPQKKRKKERRKDGKKERTSKGTNNRRTFLT